MHASGSWCVASSSYSGESLSVHPFLRHVRVENVASGS